MLVLVALTVALVFWIVAWAFGVHAFDAFLVVVAVLVTAFAVRMVTPFVRRQLGRE